MFDRVDALDNFTRARHTVDRLACIAVSVGHHQHPRRDLSESIEHTANAKIGGTARPDRANGRGREHGNHRFGNIGQEARHAITRDDTHRAKGGGDARDVGAQGIATYLTPHPTFIACDDCRFRPATLQHVLGKVQLRASEPHGATRRVWRRHPVGTLHDLRPV